MSSRSITLGRLFASLALAGTLSVVPTLAWADDEPADSLQDPVATLEAPEQNPTTPVQPLIEGDAPTQQDTVPAIVDATPAVAQDSPSSTDVIATDATTDPAPVPAVTADTQDGEEASEPAGDGPSVVDAIDPAAPAAGEGEAPQAIDEPQGQPASEQEVQAVPLATGEVDPTETNAAALPENGAVYRIAPTGGSTVVSSGSNPGALQKPTSTLGDYWRIESLGDQRYRIVSAKTGTALAYTDDGIVGAVGKTVWLMLQHMAGGFTLAPEDLASLRLQVQSTAAGTTPELAQADGSDAQRFAFTKSVPLSEAAQKGAKVSAGIYAIVSSLGNNQTMDVKGGSKANKGNIQSYNTNNSDAQRFVLESVGNGLYTIRAFHSDLVLEAAGGGTTNKTNVHQYKGNGTLAQLWYLTKSGTGYVLRNAKSGLVIEMAGGKSAKGTNIQLYKANGTAAQTFKLVADRQLEAAVAAGRTIKDGIYTICAGVGSGLVLDVTGGSTEKGANIQVYTSAGAFAQKAELTYIGKGRYTIQFANSGKYLDIQSGSTQSGANVQQWTRNSSRAQQWYITSNGSGGYVIHSMLTGFALDVAGSAKKANVRVAKANGSAAQTFTLNQVPLLNDGTYVFSSLLSPSQLVEVTGASHSNGANVQVSRMRRSTGQQWVLSYLGNGAYRITNKASGLALEVASGSTAKGGNIRQWKSNGTEAQRWALGVSDTGALTLRNVKSGLYLDLKGGKSSNGTNVQQWSGNDSKAQSFVPYSETSSFVTKGKTGYQNPSQYYQISAYNCVLPSYAKGFFTYVSSSAISPNATRTQCVEAFIARAYQYLGTGYVWDWSMAPGQGVDCSGLVMQCLYAVGMQTPYNPYDHMYDPWQDHNAENMHADNKFKKISFAERQRGDLIFYPGHVAIYLGNNLIINSTGPGVQIQSVYSWTVTGCSRVFV